MTTDSIEVAEEALEAKLTEMKIDGNEESSEQKGAKERSPRKNYFRNDDERRRVWEEAQKTKDPVSTGHKGTVKWYSILGRYGFIERDDDKTDVFVHQSGIAKSKADKCFLRTLAEKETVEFDLVQGEKGLEAINVTGPDGAEVQGSKAFRILLHRPQRRNNHRENENKVKSRKPREGTTVEEEEGKTDAPKTERRRRRNRARGHKKDAKAKPDSEEEVRGGSRRRANSGAGDVEAPELDKSECAEDDSVPPAEEIAD